MDNQHIRKTSKIAASRSSLQNALLNIYEFQRMIGVEPSKVDLKRLAHLVADFNHANATIGLMFAEVKLQFDSNKMQNLEHSLKQR